jgi:hypothetical protein
VACRRPAVVHRDVPSILQAGIGMDQGKIKTAGPIDDALDWSAAA